MLPTQSVECGVDWGMMLEMSTETEDDDDGDCRSVGSRVSGSSGDCGDCGVGDLLVGDERREVDNGQGVVECCKENEVVVKSEPVIGVIGVGVDVGQQQQEIKMQYKGQNLPEMQGLTTQTLQEAQEKNMQKSCGNGVAVEQKATMFTPKNGNVGGMSKVVKHSQIVPRVPVKKTPIKIETLEVRRVKEVVKKELDERQRERLAIRKQRNKESARRYREKQLEKKRRLEQKTRLLSMQNQELEDMYRKIMTTEKKLRMMGGMDKARSVVSPQRASFAA